MKRALLTRLAHGVRSGERLREPAALTPRLTR